MLSSHQVSQAVVFGTLYISYACFHSSRRALSEVKPSLIREWTDGNRNQTPLFHHHDSAERFLGDLDAILMATYALVMYFSGWLGDSINPKYVIAVGSFAAAVFLLLFGVLTAWLRFYNTVYYGIMYVLFAAAQTTGGPSSVHIVSNWFSKERRGLTIGVWASCQSFGNIIGSLVAAVLLPFGYWCVFLFNSLMLIIGALLVLVCVRSHPTQDSRNNTVTELQLSLSEAEDETEDRERPVTPRAIGFLAALNLPGVIPYSLCFGCLKLINYSFFFWLPYYLADHFGWRENKADMLSIWYDVGGIIGSSAAGLWSDYIGYRSPVAVAFLLGGAISILVYCQTPANMLLNSFVMSLAGALINGPSNLVQMTIAADIGTTAMLLGNAEAVSTITVHTPHVKALMDAVGSGCAAIGQLFVPYLKELSGSWSIIFYSLVVLDFVAILCILKPFLIDIQKWRPFRRRVESEPNEVTPLLSS